ncbi:hypothetical protein SCANM124S_06946 [Streptomyces canus]
MRGALSGRGTGRAWSVGLVVATVLTTALTIWLSFGLYNQREAEQRRQDLLAAARQSALNFTSLDYRHYDRDSANVLESATGDFKKQFAAQTEELTQLVAQNKSVSEGQVLEAGIVRFERKLGPRPGGRRQQGDQHRRTQGRGAHLSAAARPGAPGRPLADLRRRVRRLTAGRLTAPRPPHAP